MPPPTHRPTHHWVATLLILTVLATLACAQTPASLADLFADSSPQIEVHMAAVASRDPETAPLTESEVWSHLVAFEGYRLKPYKDGAAVSVGVGHNLTAHREVVKASYSEAEVRAFFRRDLAVALDTARSTVQNWDGLPRNVRLVTLDLIWCCGPNGFRRFINLRLALSYRHFNTAAAELRSSRWARQVQVSRANWAYNALRRPQSMAAL